MPQPTEALRGRVGKRAGSLIKQRVHPQSLLAAAFNCGAAGWTDLDTQLQRDAAADKPTRASPAKGHGGSGPMIPSHSQTKARI
jgi:hypothetical protein